MKKLLLALLIVSFAIGAKAQYVTIPDANFVTFLQQQFPSCMNGNKLDTSCSSVMYTRYLYCNGKGIANLSGIQYFDWLDTLYCGNNQLTSLPTLPHGLQVLYCNGNYLSALPALPSTLLLLNCDENQLTALPVLPPALTVLGCSNNLLSSIPSLPSTLFSLNCGYNTGVTSLPALPSSLDALRCNQMSLTALPALPASLTLLYCYNNKIPALPALPSLLSQLWCNGNKLSTLPALPTVLSNLDCSQNLLTTLPTLPQSLQTLVCSRNSFTTLPALPQGLLRLDCSYNQLTSLPALPSNLLQLLCYNNFLTNIPDVREDMGVFNVSGNTSLACIPAFKSIATYFDISNTSVRCLPNRIKHSGYMPAIDTMPICDLFNLNGCNVSWNINGNLFKDANTDCKMQPEEDKLHNIKVNLYQAGTLVESGYFANDYSFKTGLAAYRVEVDTTDLPFKLTCKQDTVLALTAQDSLRYNIDFGLSCKPGFDIGISYLADTRYRPAMANTIYFQAGDMAALYNGHCAAGVSGKVTLSIDGPAKLSGGVTSTSWNIPDFDTASGNFSFPIQIDTNASIGDQVCIYINVTPTVGDYNAVNNSFISCIDIVSSFDPNEKEVYPPGNIDTTTKWLTYTVRFQNTGTDTARNIYILDTLSQNVDVSSFQLLNSSHKGITQIYGNGIVKFNFPNIMLPDSNVNEPLSHGYVQYKVKLKDNLPLGTQIENTAYIYFDFNAPVVTNTTLNTITEEVATAVSPLSFGEGMEVRIYPNPATSQLYISATGFVPQQLAIYNVSGQQVWEQKFTQQVSIATLPQGIYIVELKGDKNLSARNRFVKM